MYRLNEKIALSPNEVSSLTNQLIASKQDKNIVFEGETMLITTALQRVAESAYGKANVIVANTLPTDLVPNTQYWVKTYNEQTLDNGCFIVITDNLGVAHFVGQSEVNPGIEMKTYSFVFTTGITGKTFTNELEKTDIHISANMVVSGNRIPVLLNYTITNSQITVWFSADAAETYLGNTIEIIYC